MAESGKERRFVFKLFRLIRILRKDEVQALDGDFRVPLPLGVVHHAEPPAPDRAPHLEVGEGDAEVDGE